MRRYEYSLDDREGRERWRGSLEYDARRSGIRENSEKMCKVMRLREAVRCETRR
jgi:hypothetical protein